MTQRLTVVCPGNTASERYALTLEHALRHRPARVLTSISAPLQNQPILVILLATKILFCKVQF